MDLTFRMSLLNLTNFINITLRKNNVTLSTLIKCFNEYFICNVDLNMFLILINGRPFKFGKINKLKFNVFIFDLINKND
jgi:hypothetical protein